MPLTNIESLYQIIYADIQSRLETAELRVINYERMREEYIKSIDQRAAEDKEAITKLFALLTEQENSTVESLKSQMPTRGDEPPKTG